MTEDFFQPTASVVIRESAKPTFWLISASVTFICFLSGPFGTYEALPAGLRFVYWGLIVLATGLMALVCHALIRANNWRKVPQVFLVSSLFGLIAVGFVILLSLSLLSPIDKYPGHFELFIFCFPSAAIIFFVSEFLGSQTKDMRKADEQRRPLLFSKLSKHPNAEIILSLTAQDHYVEVVTDQGMELCLMRLNDAIADTAPQEGLKVHRSHWVAKSAIEKLVLDGTVSNVVLTDGRSLRVSQSRLKELKKMRKKPT